MTTPRRRWWGWGVCEAMSRSCEDTEKLQCGLDRLRVLANTRQMQYNHGDKRNLIHFSGNNRKKDYLYSNILGKGVQWDRGISGLVNGSKNATVVNAANSMPLYYNNTSDSRSEQRINLKCWLFLIPVFLYYIRTLF